MRMIQVGSWVATERYRLLVIRPYLLCGPGLGQSRAVSKKHAVTNAAAVAHGRNGHKNQNRKLHMQESCLAGKV